MLTTDDRFQKEIHLCLRTSSVTEQVSATLILVVELESLRIFKDKSWFITHRRYTVCDTIHDFRVKMTPSVLVFTTTSNVIFTTVPLSHPGEVPLDFHPSGVKRSPPLPSVAHTPGLPDYVSSTNSTSDEKGYSISSQKVNKFG